MGEACIQKSRLLEADHNPGDDNLRHDFNVKLLSFTQAGSSPALQKDAAQKCVATQVYVGNRRIMNKYTLAVVVTFSIIFWRRPAVAHALSSIGCP